MGLTRRNTIIGLGALAGGAGVIGATGAFTTVEADRTVTVSTSGDGSANLQLESGDDDIIGSETEASDDIITISNSQINEKAKTVFNDALDVSQNGSEDVGFYVDDANDPSPIDFEIDGSSIVGSSNAVNLSTGDTLNVDIIIDLTPSGTDSTDLDDVDTVTFIADTDDYESTS